MQHHHYPLLLDKLIPALGGEFWRNDDFRPPPQPLQSEKRNVTHQHNKSCTYSETTDIGIIGILKNPDISNQPWKTITTLLTLIAVTLPEIWVATEMINWEAPKEKIKVGKRSNLTTTDRHHKVMGLLHTGNDVIFGGKQTEHFSGTSRL